MMQTICPKDWREMTREETEEQASNKQIYDLLNLKLKWEYLESYGASDMISQVYTKCVRLSFLPW